MPAATCPYIGASAIPSALFEQIRADVITTLTSISTVNGWRLTLDVHDSDMRNGEPSKITSGLTIVYQDDPTPEDGFDQQSQSWSIGFAIKFYAVKGGDDDTTPDDTLVNNIAGDIVSAMTQEQTTQRGGLALKTDPGPIVHFQATDGAFLGAICLFTVHAAHEYGNVTMAVSNPELQRFNATN